MPNIRTSVNSTSVNIICIKIMPRVYTYTYNMFCTCVFKGSYRYFYSLTITYCNKMLLIPFLRFCMVLVACEVIIRSATSVIFYALLTSAEKLLPLYLFTFSLKLLITKKDMEFQYM